MNIKIQKQNEFNGLASTAVNGQSRRMKAGDMNNTGSVKSGKSIYAGDLNVGTDPISEKRKKAQQKAMKVISDAYQKEKKLDDNIAQRQQKIEDMRAENGDALKQMSRIDNEKKSLKTDYQVADTSQEQKDLELLEKRENSKSDRNVVLTTEDRINLAKLDKTERTEYQKAVLNKDKEREAYSTTVKHNEEDISNQIGTIDAIQLSRLKTHDMVDADKQAQDIMDKTNKEVIGMLESEAKDKIDQDAKDEKQKTEKKEEKEKTEQEAADKRKAEKLENEKNNLEHTNQNTETQTKSAGEVQTGANETASGIISGNVTSQLAQTKKEIETIVNKLNLINEDIKGAAVDDKA